MAILAREGKHRKVDVVKFSCAILELFFLGPNQKLMDHVNSSTKDLMRALD